MQQLLSNLIFILGHVGEGREVELVEESLEVVLHAYAHPDLLVTLEERQGLLESDGHRGLAVLQGKTHLSTNNQVPHFYILSGTLGKCSKVPVRLERH